MATSLIPHPRESMSERFRRSRTLFEDVATPGNAEQLLRVIACAYDEGQTVIVERMMHPVRRGFYLDRCARYHEIRNYLYVEIEAPYDLACRVALSLTRPLTSPFEDR